MKLLFFMPDSMIRRCFRPEDLASIASHHEAVLSGAEDARALADVWAREAAGLEGVITGWSALPITDAMLAEAPRLRLALHAGGSVRAVLPSTIWQREVRIGTAHDALGRGVAECTLGMIIAGLKGFIPCARLTQAGGWQSDLPSLEPFTVRELFELTVGIVGASRTGRHLIRLLEAFEVDVLLHDPYVDAAEARGLGVEPVSLDELCRRSDVVTIHAPALPETHHMIGARQLALLKDQCILINTARGTLIDEAALTREAGTGRLQVFLDVTDPEPPAADDPLRRMPNVVLTPHIAGAISNGCLRLGRSVTQQLHEYTAGQRMHGEIEVESLSQMA